MLPAYRKTSRRLNGQPAGDMRVLRRNCRDLFGTDFRYRLTLSGPKQTLKTKKSSKHTVNEELASAALRPPIDLEKGVAPDHPCYFLLRDDYVDVFERYYVTLRFVPGCTSPKSVDGKTAWTTPPDSPTKRLNRDVALTFKTQDMRTRTEFVPVSSLELCRPKVQKGEVALVIDGPDAGTIVFPTRYDKSEGLGKKAMYCKLKANAKKKEEVLYRTDILTRVTRKADGPPAS